MLFAFLIIILSFLEFYAPNEWLYCNFMQAEVLLILCFGWLAPLKYRSIFCVLTIHSAIVLMTDWYITYISDLFFITYHSILLGICAYQYYKPYDIKSDTINPKNINILLRKPKKFKEFMVNLFGAPVASFGLIIGDLFQLKYGKSTIQRSKYTDEYIYANYYVIDTGFSIDNLKNRDITNLMKQRARQPQTLWTRYNCLRCFKDILNQIPNYEYTGFLPSIYYRRIK